MRKCEDNPKHWSIASLRRIRIKNKVAAIACLGILSIIVCVMRIIRPQHPSYSFTIPKLLNSCPNMVRAGDKGDGGWWLCDASTTTTTTQKNNCVVYSFGIRDNFSFDHFMGDRGCQVHGFDPSPAGLASQQNYEKHANAHYHSYGLGSVDKTYGPNQVPFRWPGLGYLAEGNTLPWELKRLPTIMAENQNTALTVLKVDVEGAEWDVMKDIMQAEWDELYMELHFPPRQYRLSRARGGGLTISRGSSYFSSLPNRPARNVSGPIDRIGILKLLNQIADMYHWEFNGYECAEIYFKRKSAKKIIDYRIPPAPSPDDEVE